MKRNRSLSAMDGNNFCCLENEKKRDEIQFVFHRLLTFVVKLLLDEELMLKHKYSRHSITPEPMPRFNHNSPGHSFKGSTSSLASSSDGTMSRRKKKKAPAPPVPKSWMEHKLQNGTTSEDDKAKVGNQP
jgi:hypothetical protein